VGQEYGFYIAGTWVDPKGRKRFETINPATGETLGTFPLGTAEDVNAAVKAAKGAFAKWKATPAPRRGELLLEAARIFQRKKEEFGRLVTTEMGKVIAEGRADVQEVIDFFEYAAGEGRRMFGDTVPSELPSKMCLTIRLPVGPVGLITPWNFPMAIPAWKSGAALISGCTIVFKPSSLTPLCGAKFVEVLDEAGFPPGVVNMVTGNGSVVGDGIVAHPDIRAVSFTGGVDTGKHVYEAAAKKMIKVGLELGGKNAILAMDDADLDVLMDGVMFGAFGTAGQRCTATSRFIVHQKVYDDVVGELVARAKKLRVGNPIDPKTDMGPVASTDQEKKVLEYIEVGRKEGDTLLTGGKKLTGGAYDRGFFIEPTVFAVDRKARLAQEEVFGPVLSVLKAKDYDDAVAIANSVKYGLSSSIYTNDLRKAFRAMNDLEAGITYVNAPTIGAEVQLPFGGIKETGPTDTREAGPTALEEFTYWKTIYVDYSGRLQRAQIDTEKLVRGQDDT
jgi:aldehyde dehydrogenase (NAD+)